MNFWKGKDTEALAASESLDGERFRLSLERIRQIGEESLVHPAYVPYFRKAAQWILLLLEHAGMLEDGTFDTKPLTELQACNLALYEDILPGAYEQS